MPAEISGVRSRLLAMAPALAGARIGTPKAEVFGVQCRMTQTD
jgi:hypothetical protein